MYVIILKDTIQSDELHLCLDPCGAYYISTRVLMYSCPSSWQSKQKVHQLFSSFESKKLNLFPPGLEPRTFRVLGERDNHYTTETKLTKTTRYICIYLHENSRTGRKHSVKPSMKVPPQICPWWHVKHVIRHNTIRQSPSLRRILAARGAYYIPTNKNIYHANKQLNKQNNNVTKEKLGIKIGHQTLGPGLKLTKSFPAALKMRKKKKTFSFQQTKKKRGKERERRRCC